MVSSNVRERLCQIAQERILILDGAMGSMIQAYRTPSGAPLTEDDFRGERFRDHPQPLKGCNDLLCLTMPDLVSGIHEAYLAAGADIIETCSFNATALSLADYGLSGLALEVSAAAARLARKTADSFSTPEKPRFVAGSMGPTSKSASISPDLNDPAKRAVTWDELDAAYYDNARGLLDGGADILIIETIIDTLNAKAAIFAVKRLAQERGLDVPVIISASVSEGGRLLSGQTVEAFCVSVLHADPLALGLNCSFGAEKLKPHIEAFSAAVPAMVIAYPNAGFPNRLGEYDESPESMAGHVEKYLCDGLVNIVGGCCGSTPAHIAAIAEKAKNYAPRPVPAPGQKTMLAGLKVLEAGWDRDLVLIGEHTNVTEDSEFLRLMGEKDYDGAIDIAREMTEKDISLIDVCMDNTQLDAKASMITFLNLALQYPDIANFPVMIDSADWDVVESGLKCLQGKGLVKSINLNAGEAEFLRRAFLARAYGAAVVVKLIDEKGPAVSHERRIDVAARSWKLLTGSGFPPEDIVFDPHVSAVPGGIIGYVSDALDFVKSCVWIRDNCPYSQILGSIFNWPGKAGMDVPNPAERLFSLAKVYSGSDSGEPQECRDSIHELLSLEEARENKVKLSWAVSASVKSSFNLPEIFDLPPDSSNPLDSLNPSGSANSSGIITLNNYPLERVVPHINWTSIVQTWELANHTYPRAYSKVNLEEAKKTLEKLQEDAKILLERVVSDGVLSLRGAVGFFPARSEGDDIILFEPGEKGNGSGSLQKETARFIFPRDQERKAGGDPNPCLADFILPGELYDMTPNSAGQVGLFALSAGFGFTKAEEEYRSRNDDYGALLLAGLANSLVEAFFEEINFRIKTASGCVSTVYGIRPIFGYPACPDHRDREIVFRLLGVQQKCGLKLTETAMIIPAASLCGMYITHPDSFYFNVSVGEDQLNDWARRKGISIGEARKRLAGN